MEQAQADQAGTQLDVEGLWLAVFKIDDIPNVTGVADFPTTGFNAVIVPGTVLFLASPEYAEATFSLRIKSNEY